MASPFLPIEKSLLKRGFSYIAGIDEAGRGPLAGPVVSAAVILKPNARLKNLNDSKKLTAAARLKLFPEIIAQSLDFAISFVPPQTIDEINILRATQYANHLCLENLQITPDFVLVDGRDCQIFPHHFATIIKGDQLIKSIAAASVLAKVARDHLMTHYDQTYPNYQFSKHMGYGTRAHRAIIQAKGLTEIHRQSFKIKSCT